LVAVGALDREAQWHNTPDVEESMLVHII
jgi:hypothetical protein